MIASKARKRDFTIYQLKRAGIRQCDLLIVYRECNQTRVGIRMSGMAYESSNVFIRPH